MPRTAPAPLDAGIVKVRKGEAQPHAAAAVSRKPPPVERTASHHSPLPGIYAQQLRVLAFQRRTSKQALIEGWVAEQLTKR